MNQLHLLFIAIVSLLLLGGCNNNKPASEEKETSVTGTGTRTENTASTNAEPGGDGIVGSWLVHTEVFDDNGNGIMEEAEKAKAYGNRYALQLKADGSCRIQDMFNGRYETTKEKGHDVLKVFRERVIGEEDEDPAPDIFHIKSVDKNEMILQIIMAGEPSSFWIFKRV